MARPDRQPPMIHGADHAPGGPDPLDWLTGSSPLSFRASRSLTFLSVGDSTETDVLYDDWENEDNTVFGEVLSSTKLQKVTFLQQGLYLISAAVNYSTTVAAHHGIGLLDDSATTANWFMTGNMGAYNSNTDSEQFTYPVVITATVKYPRFGITAGDVGSGIYGSVLVRAVQRSGLSKNALAWLDIHYLGATLTSI